MPGKEHVLAMDPAFSSDLPLLRRHKNLPKRKAFSSDVKRMSPAISKDRSLDLEREGYSSSERIRSWIPEPSGAHAVPDHNLPLTPPLNGSEQASVLPNGQSLPEFPTRTRDSIRTASSGLSTPVMQRSPPTPETTPPKISQHARPSQESSTDLLPSARTESFETALETQTPYNEGSHHASPSFRPSRQNWLNSVDIGRSNRIGLGLGFDWEDGDRTPTEVLNKSSPISEEVVSFEGAWNGVTPEMEAVKGGADLAYRAELKKSLPKRARISDQLLETPLIVNRSPSSSVTQSPSLRQRIGEPRQTRPCTSAEDFAKEIQRPLQDDDFDIQGKLREVDNKRLSQVSATSTVVEAMVFNTPPSRKKTLRRSLKCADLTSTSTRVRQDSRNMDDREHRRLVRHRKCPDGVQRRSVVSDMHAEGDSAAVEDQDMKPSLRPSTSPEDAAGIFDIPVPERRILSAQPPTSIPKADKQSIKKKQLANAAPEQTSSGHVSKNNSRATSSTSAAQDSPSPPTRQQSRSGQQALNDGIASPDEESNSDWPALRPRSSLVTPFSLRSARSSTPGTLEVNEATAISIYPHTNKSILVVQHAPRRSSQAAEHSAIIASNAKFAIPVGSVAPPVLHQPRQLLDSPLQNPRSPPQPPDFKIVPPTPANATDISSPERQAVEPSGHQPPQRRLSNRVKRAFSARRYSDAFVFPLTRSISLSRRNVAAERGRRASTGIDADKNLHPFWRPRAFWDAKGNDNDSDSDFGNDGHLMGNSLGMETDGFETLEQPKRRVSLSQRLGAFYLPRRKSESMPAPPLRDDYYDQQEASYSGSPRRPRLGRTRLPSLRHKTAKFYRRSSDNNHSYEFIQRPSRLEQQYPSGTEVAERGGSGGVPRLGYQVQFVGFKGLAEKVKERREEARREKVRERLRESIDVLRGV
ncbi:MAG: hypothetical protein Q9183_001405 [Haloplaca sp. 2 TL-2023]